MQPWFLRKEIFPGAAKGTPIALQLGDWLTLHGAKMRTGIEEEAVVRLTSEIEPTALRNIVSDCLRGDTSPASTLCALVRAGDLEVARHVIDEVTHKAATISRAGDNLVRDRADELTQLFVEIECDCTDGAQLIRKLETTGA